MCRSIVSVRTFLSGGRALRWGAKSKVISSLHSAGVCSTRQHSSNYMSPRGLKCPGLVKELVWPTGNSVSSDDTVSIVQGRRFPVQVQTLALAWRYTEVEWWTRRFFSWCWVGRSIHWCMGETRWTSSYDTLHATVYIELFCGDYISRNHENAGSVKYLRFLFCECRLTRKISEINPPWKFQRIRHQVYLDELTAIDLITAIYTVGIPITNKACGNTATTGGAGVLVNWALGCAGGEQWEDESTHHRKMCMKTWALPKSAFMPSARPFVSVVRPFL